MISSLGELSPLVQALLATLFTYLGTMLGAASVFLSREFNQKVLDWSLGFAGGVMVAASFWSLLAPAIELSKASSLPAWFPPLVGFMLGATCLYLIDTLVPLIHPGAGYDPSQGAINHTWRRAILLFTAITLHNIPEGLAVGVAFGAAEQHLEVATVTGALALSLGIALQNFPEGMAISLPLLRDGMTRRRSFWYGQLSGVLEPVAGVLGAAAVLAAQQILPYALSFAAGAMIFVVFQEVIPEAHRKGHTNIATMGAVMGYMLMMVLDLGLG
jgi:ZIP family zinc transporter